MEKEYGWGSKQKILFARDGYAELDVFLKEESVKSLLLVCGNSVNSLAIGKYFQHIEEHLEIKVTKFSDFHPNPTYDSVEKGVQAFKDSGCDCVIAVGGGSAMDVAKCIKMFATMKDDVCYLEQAIVPNHIKLLAVPTTAGTGSEATRYAVIYYKGEKCSVTDESCIPSAVLIDASALKSLPDYQRKVTMLDAFCHAIESFWSINSTEESKKYAQEAIRLILENRNLYLTNDSRGNENMLYASNLAGKAINITQTTAGHAMSYKLTGLYGIAHGHAVALCVSVLWPYMLENLEKCRDSRGPEYLKTMFEELARVMECKSAKTAAHRFQEFLSDLGLKNPIPSSKEEYIVLKSSVNSVRLKNNPVGLDTEAIDCLYHQIL